MNDERRPVEITLSPVTVNLLADAIVARMQPAAVEKPTLTAEEFGKRIERSAKWVHAQIREGRINPLPGKPYRIPASELRRFLTVRKM